MPSKSAGFWAITAIVVVCVLYVGAYGWLRLDHAMIHTYDRGSGHGIHFSYEPLWRDLDASIEDNQTDKDRLQREIDARLRRWRIIEKVFWPLRTAEGAIYTLTGRGEP